MENLKKDFRNEFMSSLEKNESKKSEFSSNSLLFEVLKNGVSLDKERIKLEMLKLKIEKEYKVKIGDFKDFKDLGVKIFDSLDGLIDLEKRGNLIFKLKETCRNGWDTNISKNNSSFIFKDLVGFEKSKIVLNGEKYKLVK